MLESTADAVNVIGNFLGVRDVNALTQEAVFNKYQIKQVDVLVLFGGSILEGGNVLAQAIKEKIAKKYIIVGGSRTYNRDPSSKNEKRMFTIRYSWFDRSGSVFNFSQSEIQFNGGLS